MRFHTTASNESRNPWCACSNSIHGMRARQTRCVPCIIQFSSHDARSACGQRLAFAPPAVDSLRPAAEQPGSVTAQWFPVCSSLRPVPTDGSAGAPVPQYLVVGEGGIAIQALTEAPLYLRELDFLIFRDHHRVFNHVPEFPNIT